ncbi:MAG: hypothetical protein ACJAS1_001492 [Oleiphilaceae bacterium]|jgi:hypothetical protein
MSDLGKDLPAEEGHQAYLNKRQPSFNPYPEKDWRHIEWYLGWSFAKESNDENLKLMTHYEHK